MADIMKQIEEGRFFEYVFLKLEWNVIKLPKRKVNDKAYKQVCTYKRSFDTQGGGNVHVSLMCTHITTSCQMLSVRSISCQIALCSVYLESTNNKKNDRMKRNERAGYALVLV